MNTKIFVTKTFLPQKEEYLTYLSEIWKSGIITNQGTLVQKLEGAVKDYLDVENFHYVANGTLALQLALRSMDITSGEVITTPFSYVATISAILWERCKPVFLDITSHSFCIDTDKIEQAITKQTKAIMGVHVFGYPCEVIKIEQIARKYNLKVIYDGAHAFGVEYKGKSLLKYGDISTCSFHATKLFHTVEGGACIIQRHDISNIVDLMKRFGHFNDNHYMLGINAKSSELHAAMGLCNLKYIDEIINSRCLISKLYDEELGNIIQRPIMDKDLKYNYSYYPVIFQNENQVLTVMQSLNHENIFPRRYFYPSLNTLPYLDNPNACPISEDISKRILCLPLYHNLEKDIVYKNL